MVFVLDVQICSIVVKGTHTDDTINLVFPCEVEPGDTTKWVDVALTPRARSREVLASNLGRVIGCPY